MEKIIRYQDLPKSKGQSIYLRLETDPALYFHLMSKGYVIVNDIFDARQDTIYVTGKRQALGYESADEYIDQVHKNVKRSLKERNIEKPKTIKFNYLDLLEHKYQVPFVLKNENINGGREKFLIANEEDYDSLLSACDILFDRYLLELVSQDKDDIRHRIDYEKYLETNFSIQEYIQTPSEYNTTVRLITTPSDDLLYASLKYKEQGEIEDTTTLLGYLLTKIYPLSTKSIVSNTLSGGENILIGEPTYNSEEKALLDKHNISSDQFEELVEASKATHKRNRAELGIICGFDYIYDKEREKWYLLEFHSRPMVGDYVRRQGIGYRKGKERINAEGRVRATALSLSLKKTKHI